MKVARMNASHPLSPAGRATDPSAVRLNSIPNWKHALDLCCILLTAPAWLPVAVLISMWIKLVSRGPVFFLQERIGLGGKKFWIYKFRSMTQNADAGCHEQHTRQLISSNCPMVKLDASDRRIIPGGRFLRATGLDELPQLFNVMMGTMSLVGPRPCLPREFEQYNAHQCRRVQAPPGLTGYWQVNGKNRTTFTQMIDLDIYYAEHMSPWLDVWIMVRTFPALATQFFELKSGAAPGPAPSRERLPRIQTFEGELETQAVRVPPHEHLPQTSVR